MQKLPALSQLGFTKNGLKKLDEMHTLKYDILNGGFSVIVNKPGEADLTIKAGMVQDAGLKARIVSEVEAFQSLLDEPEPENELKACGFEDVEPETKVVEVPAKKETVWKKPQKNNSRAMSTRAPTRATKFTDEQITTIKNTVAKGASQSEFEMFMYLCDRYQLDPFLKEIFYSSQMKTIMTSRDGYLKIAQRDPDYEGLQSMAVCEGDDFELDVPNSTVKHKFTGKRGAVIGAWAIAYRKGRRPVIAYADFKEYTKNSPVWNYKSAMICKCAETFVLKRQFGISGLVTVEEIGTANADEEIYDAEFSEE